MLVVVAMIIDQRPGKEDFKPCRRAPTRGQNRKQDRTHPMIGDQ